MLAAARNGDTAAAEIWYSRAQGAERLIFEHGSPAAVKAMMNLGLLFDE